MDFELDDDQQALQQAAREMLTGLASSTSVRKIVEAGGGFDDGLWRAMVEQGWPAVELSEEDGGLGLGPVEVAVLAEEVGRRAAPAPFTTTVLALGALVAGGELDIAGRVAAGDAIACVAWSRNPGAVRAQRSGGGQSGDGWIVTGRTDPAPYAPSAAVAVVTASTPKGPVLVSVDLDAVGRPAREPAMDRTRELGWLEFENTPATALGGEEAVVALVDRGATFAAAEMLGGASQALDLAVEYAKERVQFGRPIGSFQAVKHRCADMLVDVEGMRSSTYWASWCISAATDDASIAASTAKVWTSDASKRVMASSLQVHGGIGFTWEHDLHLFLKRAQLDQLSFGDASFHRERLAGLLRPRVEAGESVI
jgi:alkylation response protein AidB-like acyl-CoA dehydrogenase